MAQFIEEALDSLLNQTYENIQCIIIDDGSVDDTKARVSKYLEDPRFEYHFQENKGQTVAKNEGIKRAKGEYVCFLDSDNVWTLDKVDVQLKAFENLPEECKIIYTEQLYIDGNGDPIHTPVIERFSGQISEELLFENFVTFNTVMVKKECFDELGLMDENLKRSIDYELWLRFSTKYHFQYIANMTTYYRHWEGQMSNDKTARYDVSLQIMADFMQEHKNLLRDSVVKKAWANAFLARGNYARLRNEHMKALKLYFKAFKYNPLSLPLLKSLVKMIIRWKS